VLQVKAPDVGAPDEIQIWRRPLRPVPPQPQNPRFTPTLASRQPLDLHKDEGADHDGQWTAAAPPLVILDLRVQPGPRPHTHSSVTGVLTAMLGGGFGPGARVRAPHLGPVAPRASDVFGRVREARVAVEAAPGAQADEDLARAPLQLPAAP
jgi:hypothetical protein